MIILADNRINASALSSLSSIANEIVLMPAADYLQAGVASHPDMLLFIGFERIFCHRRYFEQNGPLLERISALTGYEICISDEPTDEKYPHDVLFNAVLVGKRLICNTKTVSKLILSFAEEYGYETVHVPQGYTKCSVAVVSDNAIITSDKAISSICSSVGIDVLTVTEGHISLPPYDYGFIGGTCGTYGDKIYFCGSIEKHPHVESIKSFCKNHGKTAISLSNDTLQDVGSLLFI